MFKVTREKNYTKVIAEGYLNHSDYTDTLIPALDEAVLLKSSKIMVDMTGFSSIQLKAILTDIQTGVRFRKDFTKIAIVSDKHWVKLCGSIFRCIVTGRILVVDTQEHAEEWLNSTKGFL
jgi:hypothetical protein